MTRAALLIRNALIGLPIAVWMLWSVRARRPLTFEVGTSLLPSREREMERAWYGDVAFRRRLSPARRRLGHRRPRQRRRASLAIALTLPVDAVPGARRRDPHGRTLALARSRIFALMRAGAMRMVFEPA